MTQGEADDVDVLGNWLMQGRVTNTGQLFQYVCGESGRALWVQLGVRRIKEGDDGSRMGEGSGSDIAREPTTRLATIRYQIPWGCLGFLSRM